jgi:hypothetical protein
MTEDIPLDNNSAPEYLLKNTNIRLGYAATLFARIRGGCSYNRHSSPRSKKAAYFLPMFAKTKCLTNILNVISCEGQPDSTVSESRCPGEIARAKRIRDAYFKDKADGDLVAT